MSVTVPEQVLGRAVVIKDRQVRSPLGAALVAGDVLATGVILQVERDDEAREVRLEMPGSDIHYVGYDDPVTVLARLEPDLLDAIALGTFINRAERRQRVAAQPLPQRLLDRVRQVRDAVQDVVPSRARNNRGRLGDYATGVRHYIDVCPIHGETTFARHKAGMRAGRQRYHSRCLACHSDYNLDHPTQEDPR